MHVVTRRRWAGPTLLAASLLASAALVAAPAPAQAADPQLFGIKITRVQCTSPCDEEGLEGAGALRPDFYAKVFFDGREHTTPRGPEDSSDIRPNWIVTETLPAGTARVNMAIQVWDHDTTSADDLADATPRSGDRGSNLEFQVNLATGGYSGDLNSPAVCAEGNGDGDGDVRVCFEVVYSANGDLDGDAITDGQEIHGIDSNLDGRVDYTLPGGYRHRDLYVEADWVEHPNPTGPPTSFAPDRGAIQDVVAAFAAAPLDNPDGARGIALHVEVNEAISMTTRAVRFQSRGPAGDDDFDDFKTDRVNPNGACPGTFGSSAERSRGGCADVLAAKKMAFRYMWFGDQYAENMTSSGISELNLNGGNDFMVTLGGWNAAGITAGGGRRLVEAGTFMHEFGHDLGLAHGGRTPTELDGANCKPNYLSVMNYLMQTNARFNGTGYTRPLNYSDRALPDLVESGLDENLGLQGPPGERSVYSLPNGTLDVIPATGPVNWNGSAPPPPGGIETARVSANINNMPAVAPECASGASGDTIRGREDWSNLHYELEDSPDYADGVTRHVEINELTEAAVLRLAPPDVRTTIIGPAEVTAGGPVAVTATATNAGPGGAERVALTITQPGPTTATSEVGPLAPQAAASRTQTVTVPCSAADGSTVVSTASAVATGAAGQADVNPSNDTASVTTTVRKAVPELIVATTPSSHAGEQITVTLTYRNTGTVTATGAAAQVVLPKDVYYSAALDPAGAPRPTTVDRRADGTTLLAWALPDLAAGAAAATVVFRVRSSLLTAPGTALTFAGTLATDATNGCPALTTSGSASTVATLPATAGTPVSTAIRSLATTTWTPESLARIHATDQRFDGLAGAAPDGAMDRTETRSVYGLNIAVRQQLRAELASVYFNLAERRFNNDTTLRLQVISPVLTTPATAGDAARQAQRLLDAAELDTVAAAKLLAVLVPLNAGALT
jgi:hypothetical protein